MNEANARIELEKYEQTLINETANKIKNIIFDGVSKTLSYLEVFDKDDSEKLEEELKTNNYLQDQVINISKSIAPWIPYIRLTLAGISIGKLAYTRYLRQRQSKARDRKDACETPGGSQEKTINKNKENDDKLETKRS